MHEFRDGTEMQRRSETDSKAARKSRRFFWVVLYLLCPSWSLANAVQPCKLVLKSVILFCFKMRVLSSGSAPKPTLNIFAILFCHRELCHASWCPPHMNDVAFSLKLDRMPYT